MNNTYGGERNSCWIPSDPGFAPREPLINATQTQMLFMGSIESSGAGWNLSLGPGNSRHVNLSPGKFSQPQGHVQNSLLFTSSGLRVRPGQDSIRLLRSCTNFFT